MPQILHRAASRVWRRIPAGIRQKAADAVIDLVKPRLAKVSADLVGDRTVPRIVAGLLSSPSGLGQSARLAAAALENEGYRVLGLDLCHLFQEVSTNIAHGLADARGTRGPAHIVLVVNAPYVPYVLAWLGQSFLGDKFITGYWAWELARLPPSWQRGFAAVHAIAVPSQFTAGAVAGSNIGLPVQVCPHPVALDHPPLSPFATGAARPTGPFTVMSTLSLASGFERKNPVALIRAFKLAFGSRRDRFLRLHITGAEHCTPGRLAILQAIDGAANIQVVWEPLTRAQFFAWWGTPDVYALLHRSEGFGLPLAEAMAAGIPVVATGWSGNMDFMTARNSHPVRYQLCDVVDPQRKYGATEGQWAEPDAEHAAELFQMLAARPDYAREVGETAHRAIHARLTGQDFCRSLLGVRPMNQMAPRAPHSQNSCPSAMVNSPVCADTSGPQTLPRDAPIPTR
jgi:glycosyltransferase involved in cell wall biosynthesis